MAVVGQRVAAAAFDSSDLYSSEWERYLYALLADLQTTLHNNSANLTGAAETTATSNYGLHVTSHSYQYQDGDDIQQANGGMGSTPRSMTNGGQNMQELDSLLEDLNRSRYSAHNNVEPRPSVDVLLNELSTAVVQTTEVVSRHNAAYASTATEELDDLMASLSTFKDDMNKQGISAMQKGSCSACDKPIVGQVITALGRTWHPEHFVCMHCRQELGTVNFFERDGQPYCEADYHNLFSPRCAYCNGPILDKCVTALDQTWHPDHFFCAQCGCQFGDDGFHEKDGKPYCKADYLGMFALKCKGCNMAITEGYISALSAQWHPQCFVCRDCNIQFQGGSFFVHEGMPYCETHYHAKRGSLCAGCHKPITGRCITAMFRKFHPEHFVCSYCLQQLKKGTFKEHSDKPYCHGCFERLFG